VFGCLQDGGTAAEEEEAIKAAAREAAQAKLEAAMAAAAVARHHSPAEQRAEQARYSFGALPLTGRLSKSARLTLVQEFKP